MLEMTIKQAVVIARQRNLLELWALRFAPLTRAQYVLLFLHLLTASLNC
jgi:hypothetical protein